MKFNQMLTIQKSITEEEIIRGCRKGRQTDQRTLYDRVSGKMLAVCNRYIRDREEAEHVMIGGMVKVFNNIQQYSGEGSFEGWIRRIMVNESLMYIRKHRAMSVEVEIEKADFEPNIEDVSSNLQKEDLMRFVQELPVGYRTVFNLYAIEGYNHAEIADMLGVSENTSKSQLSRARKLLQTRIGEMELKEKKTSNG
ncbi:MAG: sigma-70 family RNA polymerase sigma factor [Cyclobacteriaceae bacterium]